MIPRIRRLSRALAPAGWAILWLLVASSVATACPSCKTALASERGGQGDIVTGFMWSILFMLSMPFSMVIGFSTYMYVLVRRARSERAQAAVPPAGIPDDAGPTGPEVL